MSEHRFKVVEFARIPGVVSDFRILANPDTSQVRRPDRVRRAAGTAVAVECRGESYGFLRAIVQRTMFRQSATLVRPASCSMQFNPAASSVPHAVVSRDCPSVVRTRQSAVFHRLARPWMDSQGLRTCHRRTGRSHQTMTGRCRR